MTITHKLTLDLQRKKPLQRLDVVQGDTFTRQVNLDLLCDGRPWNIPHCKPVVRYSKQDGTEGIYDTLPDGTPGITCDGNTLTLELAPQMLTCPGPVQVQVELNLEDRRLATFTFLVVVEPGVALAGGSEDYVNWVNAFLPQTSGAKVGQYIQVAEVDADGRIIRVVSADKSAGNGGSADLTGYATEQFVRDGFQPKGDYLPTSQLPDAVNDALAQAKESGEFNGAAGSSGLSVYAANITAGDAQKIVVYPEDLAENEINLVSRGILLGDKILTKDGKVFIVDSWSFNFDSSGESNTGYNATLFADVGGAAGEAVGTVPDGVKTEASALVDKALSRAEGNALRFAVFSDAHQKNDDANVTAGNKELGLAIGEVVNQIGLHFVSNLGDSAWGAYADTTGEVREQLKAINSFVEPYIRGEQQLNCEGNHDDANYSTIDNDGDGTAASDKKLSPAEVFALVHAKNRDVVYDADHAIDGYCYKDFPHIKTRVICLNTEQGTGDGGVMEGYQLKWFAETALNMEGKTGWNVVTLAHHPLDYPTVTLFRDAVNIIEAFINGASLSFTTNNGTAISVDYSGNTCQYVGHFHGHTHSFSVVRLNKYTNAAETSAYTELTAWQIGVPNACYTRSNEHLNKSNTRLSRYSTPTTYQKSAADGKRTSFNLVTVDLDNKIIYADNYGAGIDRQVSYTFAATIYTIQRSLTNCAISNGATGIEENASYAATITPDDGCTMASITVTMGDTDITTSAVNGREITIGNVTGNIVITAAAEAVPVAPGYTNLVPTAKASDGVTIYGEDYNGDGTPDGYKNNTRLGSNVTYNDASGAVATGIIEQTLKNPIYIKGNELSMVSNTRLYTFKNYVGGITTFVNCVGSNASGTNSFANWFTVETLGDKYYKLTPTQAMLERAQTLGVSGHYYYHISLSGTGDTLIITDNEPIE